MIRLSLDNWHDFEDLNLTDIQGEMMNTGWACIYIEYLFPLHCMRLKCITRSVVILYM